MKSNTRLLLTISAAIASISQGFDDGRIMTEEGVDDGPIMTEEEILAMMPDDGGHLIESQISPDPYDGQDPRPLILDGTFSLVNIYIPPGALKPGETDTYGENIRADFCAMDYSEQKKDPSSAPMHRDIMGKIKQCTEHRTSFQLADIVAKAREFDSPANAATRSMDVKGIVYHLPKSGSSVISNALVAASPSTTRVISESNVLTIILKACRTNPIDCSKVLQSKVLADAIYMLGRTNDPQEENLYLRIDPEGALEMDVLHDAFEEAKKPNWVFVERNADEVLSKVLEGTADSRYYMKSRKNPPAALTQYVHVVSGNTVTLTEASDEEVISATLGAIVNKALKENAASDRGKFVDYEDDILNTENFYKVLEFLGVDMEDSAVREAVDAEKAKRGNGVLSGQAWSLDTVTAASTKVASANGLYLTHEIERVQDVRRRY
mmetsp:Transcript_57876/g.69632  ORF Transcript_57876/g.69632 Transcript_57876/m.69632 type:complete len:437 (+) Transcript_57876:94-1404(+)